MKNKRIYLLPVISFSLLAIFRIIVLVVVLNTVRELGNTEYGAALRKGLINFELFFWPALLICEIVIYLVIRKRLYKKLWVIFHSWCCIIAVFVLPVLTISLNYLLVEYYPPKAVPGMVRNISLLGQAFFYFLMAIGHLFFILTIIKSFSKNQVSIVNETPGVLDELVG